MENFIFNKCDISQHIVKYGVDIRPSVILRQDKEKLQTFCNIMVEDYPAAFETMLIGHDKLSIQKTYVTSNQKKLEIPTFALTNRGFVFTFPIKLFIDNVEDFDLPDKAKILRTSLAKFRKLFAGKKIVRVGQVNELVFDCGSIDPVEVISSAISKDVWRSKLSTIRLHLENPTEQYNINVDISPAYAQRAVQTSSGTVRKNIGYGINIECDINNRDMSTDLEDHTIAGIQAFADDYVSEKLIKFLNNENLE